MSRPTGSQTAHGFLPAVESAATSLHPRGEPAGNGGAPHAHPDKINILLVDDTPDKLIALEASLSTLEQNVVKAESGTQALRHILRQEFAVILLDVNMPGMDGFETAELIRKRQATAHVPIIFVTSFSTADTDVFRGYSLGAVDYIFTPVVPEVLRSKVSVFIELHRKTRQIQEQAEQLRRLQEERFQRKLDETNERLEWETQRNRFFRLSIELLAIADYQGRLTQLNPTWEKALGYTEVELKGASLLDFVHPEDRVATADILSQITTGDTPLYFENRFRSKNGAYRWLGWTIAPFAAEGLLYIFTRDITERAEREGEVRKLNENLRQQKSDLEAANQELEAFSYAISHDLRGPLRAITGYSELLIADHLKKLNKEGRQMLEALTRNSVHMGKLIDDFLDFFRLGRLRVNATPVDMNELVQSAIEMIAEVNERRAPEFKIQSLPSAVGDRAMLRQVLLNLLANAVKFTGRTESPLIEIGTRTDPEGVVYYIRDNGVGFDMKYYGKLFGVFQRLHIDQEFQGTGIGLALVQKIIQQHGGRIWAEGKVNEGATFFFTLAAPAQV